MKRIVYIRGKFKMDTQGMKEAYLHMKEMMKEYDLEPQYIGVIGEGWNSQRILTIQRKEKQLLLDLDVGKSIDSIEFYTKVMKEKEIIGSKSYLLIDKKDGVIGFWSNANLEKIDFFNLLEKMREYVEPGVEEICDWESDSDPIVYLTIGSRYINTDSISSTRIDVIHKKIIPLDIPVNV